ncbi:MAG: phytanoyl-CoA dioxygenase family protein, partial [Gammaproteobacteria bacterium]|nr:phytanoyl-CoA dioxygenase family protein [Gammaproteobacteria bacterium]
MGKLLTDQQISGYRRHGYVAPVSVLSAALASEYLARLEQFETADGRKLDGIELHKSYLIFTWLDELVRHPKILDAVEDLIGADILVFSSSLFIKEPGDTRFISWHQDSTYWSFEPNQVLTAWVALTESNRENGCLRIALGTHLHHQLPHKETDDS